MNYIFITGVSTGIGKGILKSLIENNYHVFGTVRKQQDADALQLLFKSSFTPILLDVNSQQSIDEAYQKVATKLNGNYLNGLINNAGIAIGGPLMHQSIEEVKHQFNTNVFGLLAVTQTFLPLLGAESNQKNKPGKIINISSISGKITAPFIGAYSASKHAVEALSDGLRRELSIYGIDVVIVEPGCIKTAIWDKAEAIDSTLYAHTDYAVTSEKFRKGFIERGRNGLNPKIVAKTILKALKSNKPKTRYPLPDQPVLGWLIPKLLPDRWFDYLINSKIGLKRKLQST